MQMISNIILKIKRITSTMYSFRLVDTIQEYLNHPVYLGEDEMFEESLKRESREENNELQIKTKLKKKKSVLGFRVPEY